MLARNQFKKKKQPKTPQECDKPRNIKRAKKKEGSKRGKQASKQESKKERKEVKREYNP